MSTPPQLPASFWAAAELALVPPCCVEVCLALNLATLARSRSSMSLTSVSTACTCAAQFISTLATKSRLIQMFMIGLRSGVLAVPRRYACSRRGPSALLGITQVGVLAVERAALALRDVLRSDIAARARQEAALGVADPHGLAVERTTLCLVYAVDLHIGFGLAEQSALCIVDVYLLRVQRARLRLVDVLGVDIALGTADQAGLGIADVHALRIQRPRLGLIDTVDVEVGFAVGQRGRGRQGAQYDESTFDKFHDGLLVAVGKTGYVVDCCCGTVQCTVVHHPAPGGNVGTRVDDMSTARNWTRRFSGA